MNPAIHLEDVGKRYRITGRKSGYRTLRESLMESSAAPYRFLTGRTHRSADEYIWALEKVTLDIQPGEVVGVIGHNGAGKSTLLKILARATEPTTGRVEFRGRIGSLLDVGTGFHSELSGRENVYLNGAILGMAKSEVARKFDEIVDFAGVEQFIDTPIKHYSDGMRMRLGFAVAAHLDTEILLADEVLAVGDAMFQEKCLATMGSLARSGRTVLFVSHNLAAIGKHCPTTVLLEHGRVAYFGKSAEVIPHYLSSLRSREASVQLDPPVIDKGIAITKVAALDADGTPAGQFNWQSPISIVVEFVVTQSLPSISIWVGVKNGLGVRVLFSWIVFQERIPPGRYRVQGEWPSETLNPGRHTLDVVAELYDVERFHDAEDALSFQVFNPGCVFGHNLEDYAPVYSRIQWRLQKREQ